MYACMYVCMHVCMHACMYVCMYACMHVCMHACMHLWTYVYMYMYVCAWSLFPWPPASREGERVGAGGSEEGPGAWPRPRLAAWPRLGAWPRLPPAVYACMYVIHQACNMDRIWRVEAGAHACITSSYTYVTSSYMACRGRRACMYSIHSTDMYMHIAHTCLNPKP